MRLLSSELRPRLPPLLDDVSKILPSGPTVFPLELPTDTQSYPQALPNASSAALTRPRPSLLCMDLSHSRFLEL